MTTNIHYLIAGMAVLLVVIWQYSRQRQMDDRNSRMFRRLLSVVSLDVAAELVSTGFILYAPYSFNVCRMLSNTVFYLFQALLPLLLLYYVCTLCTSRVIAPSVVLRMGIPTIALVCIILTNPFTEMLFYFDGTGYRHGPWYLLLYVSALLHIAGAAVFVAVHRASVSRRNLASLFAVFALAALGIAAQAVNPEVLTTGFGLSLSILAMYLTINNPCACMDSLTGLNDKQYLLRRMDELTDAHKAFHIITVYAYQLEHMNKIAGMRGGDEFLRRAEKNHLITQITELQLRRVCRFLRENPALRASIANVKINLSPLDLIHSESGSHLIRILGEYGLPCSCFQFEITETVATEYSASLTRVAESLQAAGIGLCLDDFGSGYANLNTVMQLPFSVIKLDRSLLFHICTDKNAALFYQSIVSAFCRLGYRIVAEGVETQEEMELLRSWNVDMIQGYYFSRPLPPDDLLRLLTGSAEMQAENQA